MPATVKELRSLKKETINAVDDDELPELLESLGLLKELEDGQLTCVNCGDVITRESLHAIVPSGNAIHVVCWKPECILTSIQKRR